MHKPGSVPAPILPQFAQTCGKFTRTTGYPRPFAALDWCRRCGQPDWAHQAGHAQRMQRLEGLNPGDMADALTYLAEYSPAAFDIILDVIGRPGRAGVEEADEEPYCTSCGAPLGIFQAEGPLYHHYRDTVDGDAHRYSVDHPTTIGWRQRNQAEASSAEHQR